MTMESGQERNMSAIRRVVIKIGTSTICPESEVNLSLLVSLAQQVVHYRKQGYQFLFVSSGAIGLGSHLLQLPLPLETTAARQACAAVGQPRLMDHYQRIFSIYKIQVGQVLLTRDLFDRESSYTNLQNSIHELLKNGVIPVLNENDSVAIDEIQSTVFGDNDTLSAYVASKLDADLLILLSDIDALYTSSPHQFPDAKPIRYVSQIDKRIRSYAGESRSAQSRGGMRTKLDAAEIAGRGGCPTVIANGVEENLLVRILSGEEVGTYFASQEERRNYERWLLNARPKASVQLTPEGLERVKRGEEIEEGDVLHHKGTFLEEDVLLIETSEGNYRGVAELSLDQFLEVQSQSQSKSKSKEKREQKGGGGTLFKASTIIRE